MNGNIEKSLITQCEQLAGELADEFLRNIDDFTHNYSEYEFAYKLVYDTLKRLIEENMP